MPLDEYSETNLKQWEERVSIHWSADDYGVRKYIDDPDRISPIVEFDKQYLGDIAGKKLVHLQCHIGTDTISLARLGADVTGLDYSPAAIERARELAELTGTPAEYVNSELYDSGSHLSSESFDIVYTGVGAVGWLPSIRGWAQVVASLLKAGGFLYVRDMHPMLWSLDDERSDGQLIVKYPYFEMERPEEFSSDMSYAGDAGLTNKKEYGWNHGVGETVSALIDAGLRIDFLHEHRFIDWKALPDMVRGANGRYELPDNRERAPLQFSIKATKH